MTEEVKTVALLEYDYDDLARQVQSGLERIGVNFLRSHGARMRRDMVDFHGQEQIDLELSHGGHTLKVYQVGQPRGFGPATPPPPSDDLDEEFESTFDGRPAADTPRSTIARWLAALPAGEALPERPRPGRDATNPFAVERSRPPSRPTAEPSFNPFLSDGPKPAGGNPFAAPDRDLRREESLRWLKGDED